MKLAPVDYFILFLYFAFVLGIGRRLRKKISTNGDFLLRATPLAVAQPEARASLTGANVNLYCGLTTVVFGAFLLPPAWRAGRSHT